MRQIMIPVPEFLKYFFLFLFNYYLLITKLPYFFSKTKKKEFLNKFDKKKSSGESGIHLFHFKE